MAGERFTTAQKQLIGFILVLAAANAGYRLIYATGTENTAALYVGLPTLLAVGLAALPRSGDATGMLVKGSTLAVLMAGIILPEGLLCLLFILPLVTVVALAVGLTIDASRRRRLGRGPGPYGSQGRPLAAVSLPLLLLSLEGLVGTPFDPDDSATASITVDATPAEVAAALAAPPRFDTTLPPLLRIGFGRPVGATGAGIDVGDRRTIDFTGGTHDDHPLRLFGLTGDRSVDHHASMHLTVTESAPGRVVFSIDHDGTMLARWADLERAVVTWDAVDSDDAGATRVTWRLEYRRLLYPSLYFAPLQGYGMDQAAGYLLDAVVAEQLPGVRA